MTIGEIARLLRLGERTVYQLAREDRIGGVAKVGNQWRVQKSALLDGMKLGGDVCVPSAASQQKDDE